MATPRPRPAAARRLPEGSAPGIAICVNLRLSAVRLPFLCGFAVLSQEIVHFLKDFSILFSLGVFASLREILFWLRLCRAKSLREISSSALAREVS